MFHVMGPIPTNNKSSTLRLIRTSASGWTDKTLTTVRLKYYVTMDKFNNCSCLTVHSLNMVKNLQSKYIITDTTVH